jgi:hypothetical protein
MCYHKNCQPEAEYLLAIRREIKAERLTIQQVFDVLPSIFTPEEDGCRGYKMVYIDDGPDYEEINNRPRLVPCDHSPCDPTIYWKYVVLTLGLDREYHNQIHDHGWGKILDRVVAEGGNCNAYIKNYPGNIDNPYLWHPSQATIYKR